MSKTFKTKDGHYMTIVDRAFPCGKWDGTYSVTFISFGSLDFDVRGTDGTACKIYSTEDKAISAAKRYIRKYETL